MKISTNQYDLINKKKEINIGISVLRVILSFMVVLDHLYNKKKLKKYHYILYYHIPTFFLISFYYTHKTLIIPYFSWCTISWILNNIYFYLLKRQCRHSFKDFFINLLNGHIILVPLWFQNDLILLTLIIVIIIFLFKNKYIYILHILSFLAIISQYSGFNFNFFKKHFSSYHTLGRFTEAIPNAIIGFSLANYDLIKIMKNNKIISLYLLMILIIITRYNIFSDLKTFKYGGIRLNIAAFCIFIMFYLIPFQKIKNKIFISVITKITNYTAGIYFTHVLFGKGYLCKLLIFAKKGTLFRCIIIYIISYCACFVGTKLSRKTKFKHLFS